MPGLAVPDGVELYYNGWTAPVEVEPLQVSSRPVWDSSARVVTATLHQWTFKVKVVIHPSDEASDTSDFISNLRATLSQSGGWLVVAGMGFGSYSINNPNGGGTRDVAWGPKPEITSWKQLGSDQAWEFTWTVATTILDQCDDGGTQKDAIMEFCYDLNYVVDRSGFTTRTYKGHIKIPQSKKRFDSRTLTDNADRYIVQVTPPLIPNFRRETQNRHLSEDKCRLDFTVTDTELRGYAPPEDVVVSDLRHSSNTTEKGFIIWQGRTTGRYEMARYVPKSKAWHVFWHCALDRMLAVKKTARYVMPLSITMDGADLYDKEAGTFSVTFAYGMKIGELKKAIDAACIWQVPSVNQGPLVWSTSMLRQLVSVPRGLAQLKFANSEDKLVDLCLGTTEPTKPALQDAQGPRIVKILPDFEERSEVNPLNLKPPPPEESFLAYEHNLLQEEHDNTVVMPTLPLSPVKYKAPVGSVESTVGFTTGYGPTPRPIVQTRTSPTLFVTLVGHAVRAGWVITPPCLTEVGGVEAVPCNDGRDTFYTRIMGGVGVPVVYASWRRRYVLTGVPQVGLAPPDDPLQGNVVVNDKLDGFFVDSQRK